MAATNPKRSIFRSKTVQKYTQNRERSVLPRIVAPPVFLLCWLILTLLIAACVASWMGRVPLYVGGSGIVLEQQKQNAEAVAVVLLPATSFSHLHKGLPVQIHIGQDGPLLTRSLDDISSGLLSPSEVQQKYGLKVSDPALLVAVGLGPTISTRLYAGTSVQAQIQIGSQSLLALFPVFNVLLKDK